MKLPSWLGGEEGSSGREKREKSGGEEIARTGYGTVISVNYREVGKKGRNEEGVFGWFGSGEGTFEYELEVFMDDGVIFKLKFKDDQRFLAGDRVKVRYWEGKVKEVEVVDRFIFDYL